MTERIGFYVCHCGANIADKVRVEEVRDHVAGRGGVVISRDYPFMCSDPGQDMIAEDIEKHGLTRVVVAACSPRMHERTFRQVCGRAGVNPYEGFQMVCIREHCSWVTKDEDEATRKAKGLCSGGIRRVSFHEPLEAGVVPVNPDVLVVGGGIAGMQASLDIAKAGYRVTLVERSPTLGGHMLQYDKTFPTLDCSACIGTPKMVSVGQNPNITLMTCSEVIEVNGFVGNFEVKIRKQPRYVDESRCTGCGVCSEKCPVKVKSEWDEGLIDRKAIYTPFPQAVPNTRLIDAEHCIYFKNGKCRACEKFCEPDAVDFDQKEEIVEIGVGSIILATGFELMDPRPISEFGYGKYPNVLTSLEFERLTNATGPTGGELLTRNDEGEFDQPPSAVGILHCVGSRDVNYHEYCSRVCCMYALKYAHLIKERLGEETAVYNFYIDLRCFGKGYEEFLNRVQSEGVKLVRGKAGSVTRTAVTPEEEGKLIVVAEDTLSGKMMRVPVDMVVLCTAMEPCGDAGEVARVFGLSVGRDGFFLEEHPKLEPVSTPTAGVFVAGACQGPKDIPDAVAQAKGAASEAVGLSSAGEVEVNPMISRIDPEICVGCQICRELCPYSAIELDAQLGVSTVNEAMCKGCGGCAAVCPSGAPKVKHFTEKQVFAEIEGLMG